MEIRNKTEIKKTLYSELYSYSLSSAQDLHELLQVLKEDEDITKLRFESITKELNDLMCVIEYLDLSADKQAKVYKKLKEHCRERRIIKEKLHYYQELFARIKGYILEPDHRTDIYKKEALLSYAKLFG